MVRFIWAFYFILMMSFSLSYADLQQENQLITEDSNVLLSFYTLAPNQSWRNITSEVFNHPTTSEKTKKAILEANRQIILFRYPSDGLQIKGLFSFTPHSQGQPLVVIFRGGNRTFGLLDPGSEWLTCGDYMSISSTLRGGVSEGTDEFGGNDVNDVKNMLDYLPFLTAQLGLNSSPSEIYMIGISRGGLEMFLTLAHHPELQTKVTKVVALSAILNLQQQITHRPDDMENMFVTDFGLVKGVNEAQWISHRNPLETVPTLKSTLPILIVQGTADPRVEVLEAHQMVNQLRQQKHRVDYWEIKEGNHGLTNVSSIHADVFRWLNSGNFC
jgi:dipeptidyl aminopeptidase/acylaminoacyl peptidase